MSNKPSAGAKAFKIHGAAQRSRKEARETRDPYVRLYTGQWCVSCGKERDPRKGPICGSCRGGRGFRD